MKQEAVFLWWEQIDRQ